VCKSSIHGDFFPFYHAIKFHNVNDIVLQLGVTEFKAHQSALMESKSQCHPSQLTKMIHLGNE
jgi:hypothetical protein